MSHHCEFNSKSIFSHGTQAIMMQIIILSLVTKCSVILKISFGRIFADILNLSCDSDLEHNNLIFLQRNPAYDDIPSS